MNLTPRLRLYAPDHSQVAASTPGNSLSRDGSLTASTPAAGTYSVEVSAAYAGQTGSYSLSVAIAGQAVEVTPGDQGGDLVNGAVTAGEIVLGDLDVWQVTATAGDRLLVRMSASTLTPWIRMYDPNGALAAETTSGNSLARDGFVISTATNSGPYTVVVSAAYADQAGAYALHLAKTPGDFVVSNGDQGGDLVNGSRKSGSLEVGDLDLWRYVANAGDSVMLRVGAGSFTPWIRLHGPDGALVAETTSGNSLARDGLITFRTTNAGPYTVIVAATFSGQSGSYELSFAQAPETFVVDPGDEGGELVSGAKNPGTIGVGDIDLWRYAARTGDQLVVRAGANAFTPWIRLHGPDGALVAETTSGNSLARDGFLSYSVTNAGPYTVMLAAAFTGQSGTYNLNFAAVPASSVTSAGDEGGELQNGALQTGTLDVGDLDVWQFDATAGDSLLVRMGSPTATPWIRLYDPSGARIDETTSGNSLARDGYVTAQANLTGTYFVVASATYAGQSGDYTLSLGRAPAPVIVSPGDEGGPLVNGLTNSATLTLGEMDVWSFIGTPGDSNVLRVAATGFTPWLRLFGPDGALLRETTSGNSLARAGSVSLNITNAGTYLLFVSATYGGQFGTYTLKESRVPPDLIVPPTQTLDEETPLSVEISAQDPDQPDKPLEFKLLSGPPGVTLTTAGRTNALIAWLPDETVGLSTNTITATVTDGVLGKAFTRTNQFQVVVREMNRPPVLTVPADVAIDELTSLSVQATAVDPDLPANALAFSLVDPPAGLTIDPASGAIAWVPAEDQGPASYAVTVVVTDDNPTAANARHLSVTNVFHVTVREVNRPPHLVVPADQTLNELTPLTVRSTGTDDDLPANVLGFRLVDPPAGMSIDPSTGTITWLPGEGQGPSTNLVRVVLSDDSSAAANARILSVTNVFTVVVREVNSRPVLTLSVDQVIDELTDLAVSAKATDDDLPANALSYRLVDPPAGMNIDATSGVITWRPTEAQGPATNQVTVVVTDDNPAALDGRQLSVTNRFTVVVREVNRAPVLPVLAERTIAELTPLSVDDAATDADLPANQLRYAILSGPTGATIGSDGSVFWTPTESQGPSTNEFVVVATDDGFPPLSSTNRFTVVVTEVNQAPVLGSIDPQTIHYGVPLELYVAAVDADLPANHLTYTVEQAPGNFAVDPTGKMSWTPAQDQVGTHPVTIRVMDDGVPSLEARVTFQVTVEGAGAKVEIREAVGGLKQIRSTGDVGLNYELQASADLVTWTKLVEFQMTAAAPVYIDPDSATQPQRFYRLRLRQ